MNHCPLCNCTFNEWPSLRVEITLKSGWRERVDVCPKCFDAEWREFKHDPNELTRGASSRDEYDKVCHAINIAFCDTLAVQVKRKLCNIHGDTVVDATSVINRSYQPQ